MEERIVIPAVDWHIVLGDAVRKASNDTTIVVSSEAQKQLALRAAERMNKKIKVEVAEADFASEASKMTQMMGIKPR